MNKIFNNYYILLYKIGDLIYKALKSSLLKLMKEFTEAT